MDERQRDEHHPSLSDDLPPQEFQAVESQPKENETVDNQADHAAGDHSGNKAAALKRGVDQVVCEL